MEKKQKDNLDDDEKDFGEMSDYSPKSEYSKPSAVYEACQKCTEIRGNELNPGFFNTILTKNGMPIKTWIPDSRRIFCNCVQSLLNLMIPEVIANEDKFVDLKKYRKDCKDLFDKYSCPVYNIQRVSEFASNATKTKEKYLPEIGSMVIIIKDAQKDPKTITAVQGTIGRVFGGWDNKVNMYWNEMVEVHDDIFQSLMKIMHKLNYFKQTIKY